MWMQMRKRANSLSYWLHRWRRQLKQRKKLLRRRLSKNSQCKLRLSLLLWMEAWRTIGLMSLVLILSWIKNRPVCKTHWTICVSSVISRDRSVTKSTTLLSSLTSTRIIFRVRRMTMPAKMRAPSRVHQSPTMIIVSSHHRVSQTPILTL